MFIFSGSTWTHCSIVLCLVSPTQNVYQIPKQLNLEAVFNSRLLLRYENFKNQMLMYRLVQVLLHLDVLKSMKRSQSKSRRWYDHHKWKVLVHSRVNNIGKRVEHKFIHRFVSGTNLWVTTSWIAYSDMSCLHSGTFPPASIPTSKTRCAHPKPLQIKLR